MKRHISSLISQQFGKFANREFSTWFQKIVNSSYVGLMGLDMSDFSPSNSYKSLNKLFTRSLNEKRPFSMDTGDLISPCDSFISECGEIEERRALQIKGMSYSVDDLLGEHIAQSEKNKLKNGTFINFYLSPKDYHRYHVPINLKVTKAVHIPGKLYPVNMPYLRKQLNLFIENERVVIECETTDQKRFYMILVGALNVGVMNVSFEPSIKTNSEKREPTLYEYEELHLNKGDDFGCFEMGSTIVIVAEENMLEIGVKEGEDVRFAQNIAKLI
ncbi:MAG: phosphatidylserine decarboxylase [Helicobacteraceae bacterium]|nr:phosphatidylserine decarboxylase [Helicobacteraceae bacterium]